MFRESIANGFVVGLPVVSRGALAKLQDKAEGAKYDAPVCTFTLHGSAELAVQHDL